MFASTIPQEISDPSLIVCLFLSLSSPSVHTDMSYHLHMLCSRSLSVSLKNSLFVLNSRRTQTTEYTSDDERFMLRAIELANTVTYEEHTNPNPIVGCVLVDPSTNEIVGEGYHPKAGEPHAEVHALRAAGKKAKGATAYVTLEPCNHFGRTAACSRALVDAGVKRVLIGAYDTDPRVAGGGMKTLLDRGIEVVCGCKEKEATEMNRAFFDRIEKERLEKEAQTRRNKT